MTKIKYIFITLLLSISISAFCAPKNNILFFSPQFQLTESLEPTSQLKQAAAQIRAKAADVTFFPTFASGVASTPWTISNAINGSSYTHFFLETASEDILTSATPIFVSQAIEGTVRQILAKNPNAKIAFFIDEPANLNTQLKKNATSIVSSYNSIAKHYNIPVFFSSNFSESQNKEVAAKYSTFATLALESDYNILSTLPKAKDNKNFSNVEILPISNADNIWQFNFQKFDSKYFNNYFAKPFTQSLNTKKGDSRFAYYVKTNLVGVLAYCDKGLGKMECRVDGYKFKELDFDSPTPMIKFFVLFSDLDSGRHYMQITSLSDKNGNSNLVVLGVLGNKQ